MVSAQDRDGFKILSQSGVLYFNVEDNPGAEEVRQTAVAKFATYHMGEN